jgi:uncharacterized protein YcfJ
MNDARLNAIRACRRDARIAATVRAELRADSLRAANMHTPAKTAHSLAPSKEMTMKMHDKLKPALITAALIVALPAAAQGFRDVDDDGGMRASDSRYDYARVVKVDAIVQHASRPESRETCWQQPRTEVQYRPSYTYYNDNDDGDDDDGPQAVTVEGGYHEVTRTAQHCRTETNYRNTANVLGYDVTYRYGGREFTTRMDHDPGERMRVRVNYDYSVTPD